MKITYFEDAEGMSKHAATIFLQQLQQKKDLLVCAATGGSPTGLYAQLAAAYADDAALFEHLRILKLDEWGGIPMTDPNSCHAYLQAHLLAPLQVAADRYLAFNSEVADPLAECNRLQKELDRQGPIDCCILGLGKNGHLGFNEPAEFLQPDCHIAQLLPTTLQHNMAQSMSQRPTFGMTVGMRSILQSKKIILLISGKGKQTIIKKLLTQLVSTQLPASMLWLHGDVECLIDRGSVMG
jgi:galactosamine-6-phosphate isomerase